jgi:hypothetical protein
MSGKPAKILQMLRLHTRRYLPAIAMALLLGALPKTGHSAAPKPKYGVEAQILSSAAGHAYFRDHAAPDFWVLIPYYAAQIDESACSVASVQMLVNAARAGRPLDSEEELATQPKLIERVKHKAWHRGIPGVLVGHGVTLDELGEIAREALEAYGVKVASIEVVHADGATSDGRKKLHEALIENERSNRDFILLNFNQGTYTGDTDVGHIAPLGAYDEKNGRALILDPDRKWYEPYWVSEKTLLAGMATPDRQSAKNRGWVHIQLAP